jgi:hypothetical protein
LRTVRRARERLAVDRRATVRRAVDRRATVRRATVRRAVVLRAVVLRAVVRRAAGRRVADERRAVVRRVLERLAARRIGALAATLTFRTTLRATFFTVAAAFATGFRLRARVDLARVLFRAEVRDEVALGERLDIDGRVTFFEAPAFVDRARDDFVARLRALEARFFGAVAIR